MHEKMWRRAYTRELLGALAVYAVLLVISLKVGKPMAEGALKTALLVMPMAGFALMIWAIARGLRRIDEFLRQFTLENIALAAAITAGLTFTYGFLELAGFPQQSMFVVWMVLCGSFGIVSAIRTLLNR